MTFIKVVFCFPTCFSSIRDKAYRSFLLKSHT